MSLNIAVRLTSASFIHLARMGVAAVLLLGMASASAAQCYVNHAATGSNTGGSWTDAYTNLQSALGDTNCSEIWVAKGLYKPSAAGTPGVAFSIRPGQQVYGGFASGAADRGDADPSVHRTVLSGDIDNNDIVDADGISLVATPNLVGTNTGQVVLMDGTTSAGPIGNDTVLDGVVITGGVGRNYPVYNRTVGGGLYCNGRGSGSNCSPVLSRLWFSGNRANLGGAIYIDGQDGSASPVLTGSLFSGNLASAPLNLGGGGGAAIYLNNSAASLAQLTISGNTAAWGSAVVITAGGGATLRQSTISGNTATQASIRSAVFFNGDALLDQVILWGNTGGDLRRSSGTATVSNSIVQGGCFSTVTCTNLSQGDPQLGPLQNNGGATATMIPAATSPAVDFASNTGLCGDIASSTATDQRGVVRPQGGSCDIGAVERRAEAVLTATVVGAGGVSAAAAPVPASGGVNQCRASGGSCQASYPFGEVSPTPAQTTLTATPDIGNAFTDWGGVCSGTTPTCVVTMDTAKSVEARFSAFTISVSLPDGTYGTAYNQIVSYTLNGGTGPFSYSLSSLPAGFNFAAGVLTAPATQAAGNYSSMLTVTDANGASTAPTLVTLLINPAATSTSLSASSTTPTQGQSVSLLAQVTVPAGAVGSVDFFNGAQPLCTGVVVLNGQASCTSNQLPQGTATVQASYTPSNGNTSGSQSSALTITVAAAPEPPEPPVAPAPVPVPADAPWALALLSVLLGVAALRKR
ncbi:Ig-like domain-containing protein [Ottowia thiooxydans]|uniref:Ig-like domain-containing protein n=1 Tax=Ottowia thiooxydans TaxID=219182 RepID=UPI00042614BF|nr:Ig-like domain-containing protein [Ottowia thiooxydans]